MGFEGLPSCSFTQYFWDNVYYLLNKIIPSKKEEKEKSKKGKKRQIF